MSKFIKKIKRFLHSNQFNQYLSKKYFDYGIVTFSLILGFYLKWDIQNILFFSFFIWIIINPISSRLLARFVIYLLLLVLFLSIMHRYAQAEVIAIFAYYLLIIMAITAIGQNKTE